MYKHLIKCLSEIIKKRTERGVPHICQFLGEVVLVIRKLIVMSEKDGCWHRMKTDILRITYYILSMLIPKSVLVFFTFAPTSFDDINLIIMRDFSPQFAGFHFSPCLGFHTSTILAPLWFTNFEYNFSLLFSYCDYSFRKIPLLYII